MLFVPESDKLLGIDQIKGSISPVRQRKNQEADDVNDNL